jgi:hypothetical protein
MILQTVRNECVRFGGHVDIEFNYKILQLDVLKRPQVCKIHLALNRGCFETILMNNTPRTLGVKKVVGGGVSEGDILRSGGCVVDREVL